MKIDYVKRANAVTEYRQGDVIKDGAGFYLVAGSTDGRKYSLVNLNNSEVIDCQDTLSELYRQKHMPDDRLMNVKLVAKDVEDADCDD